MTASIIKFNKNSYTAQDLLKEAAEEEPDEVVVLSIKDGNYVVYSLGGASKITRLGTLELIKYQILRDDA